MLYTYKYVFLRNQRRRESIWGGMHLVITSDAGSLSLTHMNGCSIYTTRSLGALRASTSSDIGIFENIDKAILKNINIDKAILKKIDIDRKSEKYQYR